jgi:hypothetical protein
MKWKLKSPSNERVSVKVLLAIVLDAVINYNPPIASARHVAKPVNHHETI